MCFFNTSFVFVNSTPSPAPGSIHTKRHDFIRKKWFTKARAIGAALLVMSSTTILANTGGGTSRCGVAREVSLVPADFIVNLTDIHGNDLVGHGYPQLLNGVRTSGGVFGPVTWRAESDYICFDDVYDARNDTIARVPGAGEPDGPGVPGGGGGGGGGGNPGGAGGFTLFSNLRLEAVAMDDKGMYILNNIWSSISGHVGPDFPVRIPDFYLLDANGLLVPGSTLFGIVDFNLFLHDTPNFELGDTFAFVNGSNASLPGLTLSTAPFEFDPLNGFTSAGPLFTGSGYALTEHELVAVPEPGTLGLLSIALICLLRAGARPTHGVRSNSLPFRIHMFGSHPRESRTSNGLKLNPPPT